MASLLVQITSAVVLVATGQATEAVGASNRTSLRGAPSVVVATSTSTAKQGDSCDACEHGLGKWEGYSALDCICQSCDPGYILTPDVLCVPSGGVVLEGGMVLEEPMVPGYEQHAHLNCYSGHGGSGLPPDDGYRPGLFALDCGQACDEDVSCSCFVYMWDQDKCFLRSQCILDVCEEGIHGQENFQFDTFAAIGKQGDYCGACKHGVGKWYPYPEPTSALDCICQSCDPGYTLTDMFCVPSTPYQVDTCDGCPSHCC